MSRPVLRSLVVFVSGCALYTGAPEPDEPAATSHVVSFDIPQVTSAPLDVLVVVDGSPQMAAVRDHVLASLPVVGDALAAGDLSDLHVGVVTSDPLGGGQIRGGVVIDRANPDGTHVRTYDGPLGATLAARADVGVSAPTSQPLDAIARALAPSTNPGFHREGAVVLVVIVTNGDDQSPGAVTDYAAALPTDTVVASIAPASAARLDTFVQVVPATVHRALAENTLVARYDTTSTPIDGAYDHAIQIEFLSTLPLYCFDRQTTNDCTVADVIGSGPGSAIPVCDGTGARPCWRFREEPACVGGDPMLTLTFEVLRSVYPPVRDHVVGQCVVAK